MELTLTCTGPTGALSLAAVSDKQYNNLDDSSGSTICSSTQARVSVLFNLSNYTATSSVVGNTQCVISGPICTCYFWS